MGQQLLLDLFKHRRNWNCCTTLYRKKQVHENCLDCSNRLLSDPIQRLQKASGNSSKLRCLHSRSYRCGKSFLTPVMLSCLKHIQRVVLWRIPEVVTGRFGQLICDQHESWKVKSKLCSSSLIWKYVAKWRTTPKMVYSSYETSAKSSFKLLLSTCNTEL